MASPKHYALNSIENSRFVINVDVDDHTLHEVYLPHFKKVVQQGEAATLMTAYNMVRGHYMSCQYIKKRLELSRISSFRLVLWSQPCYSGPKSRSQCRNARTKNLYPTCHP